VGQALFIVAVNVVDMQEAAQDYLRKARKTNGWLWWLVTNPGTRDAVEEWLDPPGTKTEEETQIGRFYEQLGKVTEWWGRRAGQEQGWSLFAPDVVDWTSFPLVELRWDTDEAPGKAVYPPVRLLSENEPRDRRRFVRIGKFRLRKYESNFEMDLRPDDRDTDRDDQIDRKVHKNYATIRAYLRFRLRQYQRDHPDVPAPTQVILRVHTWTIPKPPAKKPWDWQDEVETPVARWRPVPGQRDSDAVLERYVASEKCYREAQR
jgi:hypothetical protein